MRLRLRRRHRAVDPYATRFVIRSRHTDTWQVRLGNCDHAHALTVLAQLEADPTTPNGLTLEAVDG